MSTTTESTKTEAPAEPSGDATATLPPIMGLPDVFPDKSAITDKKGVAVQFKKYVDQFESWNVGDLAATKASRTAAVAELRIRARILRPDGTPMLAGDCEAWRAVYSDRIVDALKSKPGFDSKRLERFQGAVRVYRTNRGMTHAIMSERLVEMSKNLQENPPEDIDEREDLQALRDLAETPIVRLVPKPTEEDPSAMSEESSTVAEIVAAAVESKNEGDAIPDPLKRMLAPVYEGQKSATGNRLQGFETVPETFGPRPRKPKTVINGEGEETGAPDSAGNVGSETLKGAFDKVRAVLNLTEPNVAGTQFADDLYRVLSDFADASFGRPDEKGRIKLQGAKDTAAKLTKVSELAAILAAAYLKDANVTKDDIVALRWKDES